MNPKIQIEKLKAFAKKHKTVISSVATATSTFYITKKVYGSATGQRGVYIDGFLLDAMRFFEHKDQMDEFKEFYMTKL